MSQSPEFDSSRYGPSGPRGEYHDRGLIRGVSDGFLWLVAMILDLLKESGADPDNLAWTALTCRRPCVLFRERRQKENDYPSYGTELRSIYRMHKRFEEATGTQFFENARFNAQSSNDALPPAGEKVNELGQARLQTNRLARCDCCRRR